jgi:hypothetical protein
MTIRKWGAAALAIAMACTAASPAHAADDKAAGVFLQCDGRTGHVTDGARLLRVLLVTATAGISEAGMTKDNVEKRAKGVAGVAACDQALASEGDAYRRIQLALARSLHFGEDQKWAEAAAAAHVVPTQLKDKAGDWGLAKSAAATSRYFEALYLVRAGKIEQAEATAWDGMKTGGPDVLTMQRMSRFIGLSRTISPDKRWALQTMQRYYPDSVLRVAAAYAEAGDFKAAADAVHGFESSFFAFLDEKDRKPPSVAHSLLATFAAMDGDLATAKAELATAQTAHERDRADGAAASEGTAFAAQEDDLAFAQAAIAAASGDHAGAAKILGSRSSWPTMPPGLVALLVGRVAPNVPDSARLGVLAKQPDAIWQEALDARLALFRKTDGDARLWAVPNYLELDESFQRLARNALTGGGKSKWLLKPGKQPRDFDVLVAGPEAPGLEAGEGILYHAALMAKARGKQGFVLLPKRSRIDWVGLRFVNPGELGIPAASVVSADEVIAALSPHIRIAEQ